MSPFNIIENELRNMNVIYVFHFCDFVIAHIEAALVEFDNFQFSQRNRTTDPRFNSVVRSQIHVVGVFLLVSDLIKKRVK